MAITITCDCGKRFRAKDEYAGRRGICPACKREFVIQAPADLLVIADPLVDPSGDSVTVKSPWWKDRVVVAGVALPSAILLASFGYLVGSRPERAPALPAAAVGPLGIPNPARNPMIPIGLSYPIIEEHFNPPRGATLFPGNRMIYIRLNMKVYE